MPKYLVQFDISVRMGDSKKNTRDVVEALVICEPHELLGRIEKKKQSMEKIADETAKSRGVKVEHISISLKNYFKF